jgi:hypothetical protein
MKYTVGWKPSAEQELARLWLSAPVRAAVTAAANRIDALLGSNPARRASPDRAPRAFFSSRR